MSPECSDACTQVTPDIRGNRAEPGIVQGRMELGRPFRGTHAIAAGEISKGALRGARFRRLFQDVYLHAEVELTYLLWCEAAALAVHATSDSRTGPLDIGAGALAGWSAAEMLGAACAPAGVPAEVLIGVGNRRAQPGLVVHRARALPHEIRSGVRIPIPGRRRRYVAGRTVRTLSPLRTAFDLATREGRIEAIIALDALARVGGFAPVQVLELVHDHPLARGVRRLPELVALADPLAESPMETRVRLALHDGGLPAPVLQFRVGEYRLDLAYPDVLLGIEYDGAHHRDPRQARVDLARQQFLTARGWHILRPSAEDTIHHPPRVAGHVAHELTQRHANVGRRAPA